MSVWIKMKRDCGEPPTRPRITDLLAESVAAEKGRRLVTGLNHCRRFFSAVLARLGDSWPTSGSCRFLSFWRTIFAKSRKAVRPTGFLTEELLRALGLLVIVIMPGLGSWEYLLLPLGLKFLFQKALPKQNWDPSFYLLVFILSGGALFAPFTALAALRVWLGWLLLAWLAGKTVTGAEGAQIIKYLAITSLIWIGAGFWQLLGAPTPSGWLESSQWGTIAVRSGSVFRNPNNYSIYLLSIIIFDYYLLREAEKRQKWVYAALLFLAATALYFTYSRMGWLIGLALALIYFGKKERLKYWPVGILLLAVPPFLPGFWARIAPLFATATNTFWYRVQIWRGVLKALGAYWLWGAGPGSFPAVYPWYQESGFPARHAHQFYLQFWLEFGIFGLSAFFLLLRRLFSRKAPPSNLRKALFVVCLVFLGGGLGETWYADGFLGGYFWFLIGIYVALGGGERC